MWDKGYLLVSVVKSLIIIISIRMYAGGKLSYKYILKNKRYFCLFVSIHLFFEVFFNN